MFGYESYAGRRFGPVLGYPDRNVPVTERLRTRTEHVRTHTHARRHWRAARNRPRARGTPGKLSRNRGKQHRSNATTTAVSVIVLAVGYAWSWSSPSRPHRSPPLPGPLRAPRPTVEPSPPDRRGSTGETASRAQHSTRFSSSVLRGRRTFRTEHTAHADLSVYLCRVDVTHTVTWSAPHNTIDTRAR